MADRRPRQTVTFKIDTLETGTTVVSFDVNLARRSAFPQERMFISTRSAALLASSDHPELLRALLDTLYPLNGGIPIRLSQNSLRLVAWDNLDKLDETISEAIDTNGYHAQRDDNLVTDPVTSAAEPD